MTDEPLDPQLTSSLLGLLAVLEGQARIGELPLNIALRLRQRLVGTGLLPAREASGNDAEEMRGQGKDVDPPVHEPALRRWTVVIHHSNRNSAAPGMEFHAAAAHGGQHLGAF